VLHNLNEIKENAILAHSAPVDFEQELNQQFNKPNPNSERVVSKYLKDMLKSITEAVEQTGFVNPMNKVYCLSKQLEQLPLMFALLTILSFESMYFSAYASSIMQRETEKSLKCDGPGFIVGMLTIFKQFHPQNENTYLNLLCHYLKNEIYRQNLSNTAP
jgi:hypothetical protein